MNDEQIIRKEAKELFELKINGSGHPNTIDDFNEIKYRLTDFYSAESKGLFLDEMESLIKENLQNHRVRAHGGVASPNCMFEVKAEKLLFYIGQEIGILPVIAHQNFKVADGTIKNKVFVSYSHLDKEFLIDIQRHFKPFLNQIDYWDDSKISPGQKWKDEIRNAMKKTKVAILLVSTDFLGSEFIATEELPPLLKAEEETGTVILIVILKPCLFEHFPVLNQFQAMNSPSTPVSKMDYNEKEEFFVNVVRQTKRILTGDAI